MENTHLFMVHPLPVCRVCRQTFYKFKWVLDLAGLHSVMPIVCMACSFDFQL